MINRFMDAKTEDQRLLVFLQLFFLFWTAFGFFYFAVEHWVIDHFMDSFGSQIPLYVALVGFPLSLAMFFTTRKAVRLPYTVWMAVTVGVGLLGALFHLFYNAGDAGVTLFSISGFVEAFTDPYRPVLAALAHVNIGAVGIMVGLTVQNELPHVDDVHREPRVR